jgi:hypothetical protein
MRKITISDAVLFLIPNSEFRIEADDLSTLEFFSPDGQKHPTQSEVDAAIVQLNATQAQNAVDKAAEKTALLAKLGITADEAALLLS